MSTLRVKNFYEPDPSSPLYNKLKKHNKFSLDEDRRLSKLVHLYGENNWEIIADMMRGRSVRQCRERWKNYLSPNIVNLPWTEKEDKLLEKKFIEYGSSWKQIANFFPNRNYVQVRNRYLKIRRNSRTKKKILITSSNSKKLYGNQNEFQYLNYGHVQTQNSYQPLGSNFNSNNKVDLRFNLNLSIDQNQNLGDSKTQNDNFDSLFEQIDDNYWEDFEFPVF